MEVKKVAVIGAGTMGHGIAQIMAMAGLDVRLVDISEEILEKALEKIKWSLQKFAEKKKIRPEEVEEAMGRIKTTTSLEEACKDIDLMVEAAPENMDLKKKIFSAADQVAPPHAILATNTSSLSITEISEATRRPDKVVGLHFFNPPQLMPLLEVIRGAHTSDETLQKAVEIGKLLKKTVVVVRKDVRGFIVNGVLGAVMNEAFWAVYRGEATIEEVDAATKFKLGFPMGMFELADFVGLDILAAVSKVMYEAFGDRAKPCPILEEYVKRGELGQKTGKGFYDWSKGRPVIKFQLAGKFDHRRLQAVAANAAAWLVYDDVADPKDIDTAMKYGTGWPQGPCEMADKVGIDTIVNKLNELYEKHKEEMYKPCPLLAGYVEKGWLGKKSKRGFYEY